jgi:hypothetical protein
MAIPLKESLHREPVHIYNLILASPRVPPGLFQRAPRVPGFLFVYDRWGSTHSMPQATTKTFTQRLFRSGNPSARTFYIYITSFWPTAQHPCRAGTFSTSPERCGVLVYVEHNIRSEVQSRLPKRRRGPPCKKDHEDRRQIIKEYWKDTISIPDVILTNPKIL